MVAVGTDFAKSNAKNWFGQTNFERNFCQNWPPMGLILVRRLIFYCLIWSSQTEVKGTNFGVTSQRIL